MWVRRGGKKWPWGPPALVDFHTSLTHCFHPFRALQASLTLAYWSFFLQEAEISTGSSQSCSLTSEVRSDPFSFTKTHSSSPHLLCSISITTLQSSCRASPVPPTELYWQRWLLQYFSLKMFHCYPSFPLQSHREDTHNNDILWSFL